MGAGGNRRNKPSEHDEQVAVVEWCGAKGVPCYAIPNGGYRTKAEAAKLRAEGVSAGVPDLCVPVARGPYHSLYIEMKAERGHVSDAQVEWIGRLRGEGMCAYVCHGASNAIALLERYLAL